MSKKAKLTDALKTVGSKAIENVPKIVDVGTNLNQNIQDTKNAILIVGIIGLFVVAGLIVGSFFAGRASKK